METEIDTEANKAAFSALLRSTNREGVESVLAGLDKLGFFTAPASSRNHLAVPGGLCQHSLNVYRYAVAIAFSKACRTDAPGITEDSVVIASLLHDVCKAEVYKQVEKFRKDADNKWERYLGWDKDYSHAPFGHGEKSVIRLLLMGLKMTRDEMLAIRWHMAAWELPDSYEARGNFNAACEATPLVAVVIAADELACRVAENPAFSVKGAVA